MKFIASFSGGKDSTAMLLRLIEESWPLDEIIYLDHGSWAWDFMEEHICQVEASIKRKITRIQMEKSLDYYAFEHEPKHRKGGYYESRGIQLKGRGWPSKRIRWCTSQSMNCLRKFYKNNICYTGIAYNEKKRPLGFCQDGIFKIYPLMVWGMTEKDNLLYCTSRGFNWGGHYDLFSRLSCWCCPLQSMASLYNLFRYRKDLWVRLLAMDRLAHNSFIYGSYSVSQLNEKFISKYNAYTPSVSSSNARFPFSSQP